VLVQEVDAVNPEALQHLLDALADVVGPAVPPSVRELEAELRREDYLVTNWLEHFAHEHLVHVRLVRLRLHLQTQDSRVRHTGIAQAKSELIRKSEPSRVTP